MQTVSAYIIGICVAVIMLIISAFVSNMITFKPDLSDCKQRKFWFWVLAVITPVVTFVGALVVVYLNIKVQSKADSYMIAMCISSVISFVLYILGGLALAKSNKHGKLGNWF